MYEEVNIGLKTGTLYVKNVYVVLINYSLSCVEILVWTMF